MPSAATVFRVVYTTFYGFLYLVLLGLLLLSPTDIIVRTLSMTGDTQERTFYIVVLSAAYLFTTLIVIFVYSSRLYINRGVLASIPKSWIPVGKGDVRSAVRKVIAASLSRSAAIAFDARPRVRPPPGVAGIGGHHGDGFPASAGQENQPLQSADEHEVGRNSTVEQRSSGDGEKKLLRLQGLKKTHTIEDELGINLPTHKPILGGEVEHSGWGSPLSPDFPNLQYSTVISELPHLLEARALTLAPPAEADQNDDAAAATLSPPPPPMLDPDAVAALQRGTLSLRDYLASLTSLGVLPQSPLATEFLAAYETARFSTRPVSARRFRELMHLFADVLRTMTPLDPAVLLAAQDDDDNDNEAEYDDDEHDGGLTDGDGGSLLMPPHPLFPSGPEDYSSDIDNDQPAATASPVTTLEGVDGANSPLSRRRSNGRSPSPIALSVRTTSSSGGSSTSDASQIRRPRLRRRPRPNERSQTPGASRARNSSSHTWHQQHFQTAPTTPKSRRTAHTGARTASPSSLNGSVGGGSIASFSQSRHPYPISHASSGSLRSLASSGSVVRLRDG